MNHQQSLFAKIFQTIFQHFEDRKPATEKTQHSWVDKFPQGVRWFIPTGGTLLVALLLIITQPVWARGLESTHAVSTATISYQGRLTDTNGNPITGLHNMEFRVYDVPTGGAPLWDETWTGGNAVQVSNGLFNVMLGSLNTNLMSVLDGHDDLYLGIIVGTDSEMVPRVQFGSVPFSMQTLTVPDASITTDKIADGAITQAKLAPDLGLVPMGTIVMWSGSIDSIPVGWALCDGTNGTPDLRDRFVVGAGNTYAVGASGGAASVTLTTNEMPSHNHSGSASNYGGFEHSFSKADPENGDPKYGRWTAVRKDPMVNLGGHTHTITIGNTGGGQAHENRPPYFALAYIMRVP